LFHPRSGGAEDESVEWSQLGLSLVGSIGARKRIKIMMMTTRTAIFN